MTSWTILRAAGIGAYVVLFLSTAWGLAASTSVLGRRAAKASLALVHGFLGTVGLVLLAIHLGGLLLDRFVRFDVADLFVPLRSPYRPVAVAFGIVGLYAAAVVLSSSWSRRWIGAAWWRRLHLLSVPAFVLSMLHGLLAGTDTARPWMWSIYVTTASAITALLVLRGLTAAARRVPSRTPQTGDTVRVR